jgi:hypothetical protein
MGTARRPPLRLLLVAAAAQLSLDGAYGELHRGDAAPEAEPAAAAELIAHHHSEGRRLALEALPELCLARQMGWWSYRVCPRDPACAVRLRLPSRAPPSTRGLD